MIQPTEKYVFTHPKDENGQIIPYRFMLTLSKPLGYVFNGNKEDTVGARLGKAIPPLDGVDAIDPRIGRYTVEIAIARTFDANQVIEAIKDLLDNVVLSEIVIATPQQANRLKLVEP